MVFVLEGSRAEVNQTNLRVEEDFALRSLTSHTGRRGWYPAVVGEGLVSAVAEQDILGLEISVNQVEIVQDCFRLA